MKPMYFWVSLDFLKSTLNNKNEKEGLTQRSQ